MNLFGLIFHQSLILFASYRFGFGQQFDHKWELDDVTVDDILNEDGTQLKVWKSVSLAKYNFSDRFVFLEADLDDLFTGSIPPTDVDILEFFGRLFRISLMRGEHLFFLNLLFKEESSALQFFKHIRLHQTKEYGRNMSLQKLVQYWLLNPPIGQERLQLLEKSAAIYMKNEKSASEAHPITINFAPYVSQRRTEGAFLVLQSKTFNISKAHGANVYVLCADSMTLLRFLLVFIDVPTARHFFRTSSVANHLNPEIPCEPDWVTSDILQQVNSL